MINLNAAFSDVTGSKKAIENTQESSAAIISVLIRIMLFLIQIVLHWSDQEEEWKL